MKRIVLVIDSTDSNMKNIFLNSLKGSFEKTNNFEIVNNKSELKKDIELLNWSLLNLSTENSIQNTRKKDYNKLDAYKKQ